MKKTNKSTVNQDLQTTKIEKGGTYGQAFPVQQIKEIKYGTVRSK